MARKIVLIKSEQTASLAVVVLAKLLRYLVLKWRGEIETGCVVGSLVQLEEEIIRYRITKYTEVLLQIGNEGR